MSNCMILYGNHESGHSYKVRLCLALAGIPHEYRAIDLDIPRSERPAEFQAVSRYGEVPVLIDAGHAYCQSNAILIYLAQKFHRFDGAPTHQQTVFEWLSWETNRIGFSIPNLRFALRFAPQPEPVLDWLRARVRADLDTLNHQLEGAEYLLGSDFTIADISCCAYLYWLDQVNLNVTDWPHIQHWLKRIAEMPGYAMPYQLMSEHLNLR